MMGLSYECEPIFEKLENYYGTSPFGVEEDNSPSGIEDDNKIEFRYVMAGLVRDVSDFMTPDELAELSLNPDSGIKKYCRRLAMIYKSEEVIGGLPININPENFKLFDAEHRSSYPLCIAYKAAQLADFERANTYLYNLRRATIVEVRQTTLNSELVKIAEESGINPEKFNKYFNDGSAENAFMEDLRYTRSLGIYALPAYLLTYGDKSILINQLIDYDGFQRLIKNIIL